MNKPLIVTSLLLWGYSMPAIAENYPSNVQAAFLKICGVDQTAYCQCFINSTQESIPLTRFLSDVKTYGKMFLWEHPYLKIGIDCGESIKGQV